MYDNSKFSKFDSPYAGGGDFIQDEGPLDQAKNFLSDHGKKIIAVIIVLAIGYFVYDFFIGSYQNVTFSVINTEGKAISGARITVQKVGETESRLVEAGQTVSLRRGSYNLEISASGFDDSAESLEVTKDETKPITLNKKLVTEFVSVSGFPTELYLGQKTTGQIILRNPGAKRESIELVLTGDLEGIEITPVAGGIIDIEGQQSKKIDFEITVPSDLELANTETGDTKTGQIQIRLTATTQDVTFKLLPTPDIEVSPTGVLTKEIESGSDTSEEIQIINNSQFAQKNIRISLALDPASPTGSSNWFSFSTNAIEQLGTQGSGGQQTVIFYAKIPALATEQKIAGQSKIIIQGVSWKKEILLNLTIKPKISKLIALLSGGDIESTIEIQKNPNGTYQEITTEYISLENQGDSAISRIDASGATGGCFGSNSFINWTTVPSSITNLEAGETAKILFKISAPQGAVPNGPAQTCRIQISYDEPLTNRPIVTYLTLQLKLFE